MCISRRSAKPLFLIGATLVIAACAGMTGQRPMGFFVSSTNGGKGADYGGLAGADRHCQQLAAANGVGDKTWRAYLSTQAKDSVPQVNARDRIGNGPWYNAKGDLIAADAGALHSATGNNITKQTALNEKGQMVNGRGDTPNRHDILTGTKPDGTAFSPSDRDMTCANWTRSGPEGTAVVGHHDRAGPNSDPWSVSWNSSHESRGGCSIEALKGTGGDALLYCFASN